jgi:methylglyoxal synthase
MADAQGEPAVALVAHDEKKPDAVELAREYAATLRQVPLVATGTTGKRLDAETDLDVERVESGAWGGDVTIASRVAKGQVRAVVFLRDPHAAQPHEPDISALLRMCDVHDVALATNRASAVGLLDGLRREVEDR